MHRQRANIVGVRFVCVDYSNRLTDRWIDQQVHACAGSTLFVGVVVEYPQVHIIGSDNKPILSAYELSGTSG